MKYRNDNLVKLHIKSIYELYLQSVDNHLRFLSLNYNCFFLINKLEQFKFSINYFKKLC